MRQANQDVPRVGCVFQAKSCSARAWSDFDPDIRAAERGKRIFVGHIVTHEENRRRPDALPDAAECDALIGLNDA